MATERKSAAAKKTAAKKAPAKKTAAKRAPAKKTPAKKAESASPKDELATKLATAIRGGEFDGQIAILDDAVTARINEQVEKESAAKKTPAKKSASKKVSPAPKRETAEKKPAPNSVTVKKPVEGKTYGVKSKKFASAKVKFLRFKSGDDSKVVVEMVSSQPGYPKGKRVSLPHAALKSTTK